MLPNQLPSTTMSLRTVIWLFSGSLLSGLFVVSYIVNVISHMFTELPSASAIALLNPLPTLLKILAPPVFGLLFSSSFFFFAAFHLEWFYLVTIYHTKFFQKKWLRMLSVTIGFTGVYMFIGLLAAVLQKQDTSRNLFIFNNLYDMFQTCFVCAVIMGLWSLWIFPQEKIQTELGLAK